MSASHLPMVVGGAVVGDLITVGDRFVFFTVRHDLAGLDGQVFHSAERAADAASALLASQNDLLPPAEPLAA